MIAWPIAADPDGPDAGKWLECDGCTVNASRYPKLAALMTSVPDYRGVFLRGYGSVSSSHFGTVNHQSEELGVLQGDAIRNITGNMGGSSSTAAGLWDYGNGAFRQFSQGRYSLAYTSQWWNYVSHGMSFDANLVVPTANENRPINRAVRWLIRAA